MIALKNALTLIRKHDFRDGYGSFSIDFMKCNRDKGTGGELISLDKACSCGLPPTCKNVHEMCGIKDMETGKKYAVHNRLMFTVNGQPIYWV